MNLFGIGTSEFLIIFILALILLGPQRLPMYANKLGQKIREWRMMSQVFMVEWKEELAALEEARQSLAEARSALLEAQETVSSGVKEVGETVSTEVESAQRDISAQLYQAEKAVSNETAQIRDTIEKAKQGKADIVTAGETTGLPAASPAIAESTGDITGDDEADVVDSDVAEVDISDVEELGEDDISSAVVENTIAPPRIAKQVQSPQPTELTEIDVTEVQTVSDVAADVAEKIATEVAIRVAQRVAKNLTSDMAEEVTALVIAKLAEAGINGNAADITLETDSTQSKTPEYQEAMNE